jgi:hypothetical protein
MSAEVSISYKPQAKTLLVIEQANGIITDYLSQGFKLTLRQLFCQFVARGLPHLLNCSAVVEKRPLLTGRPKALN